MVNFRIISSSKDSLFTSLLRLVRERDGTKETELSVNLSNLIDSRRRFVLASEGRHVIGYTFFETAPRSRGRKVFSTIETYVSLAHRREGIAHRLALALSGLARQEGVPSIIRHTQSSEMLNLGDQMAKYPRLFSSGRLKGKWAERTRVVLDRQARAEKVIIRVRKNH